MRLEREPAGLLMPSTIDLAVHHGEVGKFLSSIQSATESTRLAGGREFWLRHLGDRRTWPPKVRRFDAYAATPVVQNLDAVALTSTNTHLRSHLQLIQTPLDSNILRRRCKTTHIVCDINCQYCPCRFGKSRPLIFASSLIGLGIWDNPARAPCHQPLRSPCSLRISPSSQLRPRPLQSL
jgi:hypothetical protein